MVDGAEELEQSAGLMEADLCLRSGVHRCKRKVTLLTWCMPASLVSFQRCPALKTVWVHHSSYGASSPVDSVPPAEKLQTGMVVDDLIGVGVGYGWGSFLLDLRATSNISLSPLERRASKMRSISRRISRSSRCCWGRRVPAHKMNEVSNLKKEAMRTISK